MSKLLSKAKKIKLVATDIDGVWTDARMYVTTEGDWMKAFSTYDGMAVSMLKKEGIIVAIITSENTDIVLARAKKLQIDEVYVDEHEKFKRINYLAKKYKFISVYILLLSINSNNITSIYEYIRN